MSFINTEKMDACFRIMESVLTTAPHYQPEDPGTLSVHSGELWRREGYKYEIYERGHKLMMSIPWEKPRATPYNTSKLPNSLVSAWILTI